MIKPFIVPLQDVIASTGCPNKTTSLGDIHRVAHLLPNIFGGTPRIRFFGFVIKERIKK